jgi:cell division protein FtsN
MPRPVPTSGANAPLSIVPQQQDQAAPPPAPSPAPERTRVAREESTNAPITLGSATAPVPTPASGGGYSVQVSSQRSEEEAQAAFRSLQAKFPTQLGGRAPIIRRADLGEKGTYYRALVGPFASVEQAAEMCSSLKSAGGTCIVQRN